MHPGYGFLAENADFAQAVIDAGLIWIGPPPAAIEALGDKVKARHIAEKVGAPLAPGTKDPVKDADEVVAFAEEHGLPVAIKAAFGGGGRGLKVARTLEEIPEPSSRRSARRSRRSAAASASSRSTSTSRATSRPSASPTSTATSSSSPPATARCSAATRSWSRRRPRRSSPTSRSAALYESSKAILREAGYVGAGTCEFLVGQDGTISFLEVNTRLQVEHPVSEEVTGIDLVREMFRIADGEELGYDDPEIRGHSIEFRINAEDGGRNFMPAPGTLSALEPAAAAPASALDGGYENGETIPGAFDSLIAKLIVTGRDRTQALERSRRALDEFVVDGMPTVIPFHRAVVDDPAFIGDGDRAFGVYTPWIETEFDNQIEPYAGDAAEARGARRAADASSSRSAASGSRSSLPGGLGGLAAGGGGRREEAQARRPARRPAPRPAATP